MWGNPFENSWTNYLTTPSLYISNFFSLQSEDSKSNYPYRAVKRLKLNSVFTELNEVSAHSEGSATFY